MDLFHKFTNWIDRNRYKAAAVVLVIVATIAAASCQSKTVSIADPARKVGRDVFSLEVIAAETDIVKRRIALDAQIAAFNADIEKTNATINAGIADLDRQDAIRAEVIATIGSFATAATTGDVNSAALIGAIITAAGVFLGGGAALDSRRKDKVIEDLKKTTA